MRHVSAHITRPRSEIEQLVRDDYGTIGVDRVRRWLRRLRKAGLVVSGPDGWTAARRATAPRRTLSSSPRGRP